MGDLQVPRVRFEVLGQLRAWRGDVALELGPLQQRVVLAVLLLHANRPVGRQQFIDAVWGEAAPASAVNLLQRHVSALRRALEPDRNDRVRPSTLIWTDAGYILEVGAGDLDLEVFEEKVRRAQVARGAGDLPAAAEELRAALQLRRGPAFDGLTSPFLDAERDVLTERWMNVAEERLEVDLALSNHRRVITDLRNFVTEYPLRERLRELLMLALYRSDRQADALAVFQDARRRLHDELGVEPAASLQRLHQQILAADPSLADDAERRAGAPAPPRASARAITTDRGSVRGTSAIDGGAPAQLPSGIADFTGRDKEIDQLDSLLPDDHRTLGSATVVTVIAGTAGVGKSTLAVHWAHRVRDRFPDGQLYVNLRGFGPTGSAMQPAEAIRGFLDAFGVPPERIPVSLDSQAALYRSLLDRRRMLVVLDNARDAEQVRPLLPGSRGCLVVITSRDQMSGLVAIQGAQLVAMDLLAPAEARHLLARRLGPTRVDAEPDAVDDIINSCARLPLALSIVAARAATRPTFSLGVLADQLRNAQAGLDAFDSDDATTDVRAVFSWSYQTLSPAAAQAFRVLGLHPGPDVDTSAAASLVGIAPQPARLLLGQLTRAHLITEHVPDRFAFHDLLRAYATEQTLALDTDTDRRTAIHRMLDHYLHSAHTNTLQLSTREDPLTLVPPQPGVRPQQCIDREHALSWFRVEHPVLLAAMRQAASSGFHTHTWQLAWTLTAFFFYQGHWRDQIEAQRTALDTARRSGDHRGQAYSHLGLARVYTRLGRLDDARTHHLQALHLFEQLGDATNQAHTYRSLSWMHDLQGRHAEALDHAQRALELYRVGGHRVGRARALNAVGWYHARLGDPGRALVCCQQALALQRELGDRHGQAATWDSLGYAHHQLGDYASAIICYEQALEGFRDLGDRYNQTDTLTHLGDARYATGDVESARAAWEQALTILDELDHPDANSIRARLVQADQPGRS